MIKPMVFEEAIGESLRYGWAAIETAETAVEDYGTFYWKGPEQREYENLNGDDARIIMDRVIPFIKEAVATQKPFFSTIWFHTPHLPLVTGKKYRDLYPNQPLPEQLLYGSISAMDEQVGRLWQQLKTLGVAENTMLWFCSDNGPERDTPGSAGPFRERKRSLYEGGIRVPAFVLWQKEIQAGGKSEVPMVTLDYLPTILDYLNIPYPVANRPMDGLSLRAILAGKQKVRNQAIGFQYPKKIAWMTDQYKLISTDEGQTFELYDLLADKEETQNIATQFPERVNEMRQALESWKAACTKSETGADYVK